MSRRRDEKPAATQPEDVRMNQRTWERTMRRALGVPPPREDEKPAEPPGKQKTGRKRKGLQGA